MKRQLSSFFLFVSVTTVFVFPSFVSASSLSALPSDPLDLLNRTFTSSTRNINTTVPDISTLKLPKLTGALGDGIKFFDAKDLSSGDLISGLKTVAVLAINLFIIVVETVVGILRALLPFLQ